tara:strand:+ start:266 stop:457 length:192 start_codon:yes stop_codon:yes gene_type:complete
MMLSRDEEKRVSSYLKDYAVYLHAKADKEYSAVVQLMIRGAVADLNSIVTKLNQVKGLSNGDD